MSIPPDDTVMEDLTLVAGLKVCEREELFDLGGMRKCEGVVAANLGLRCLNLVLMRMVSTEGCVRNEMPMPACT